MSDSDPQNPAVRQRFSAIPEWQLPAGVNHGLWQYINDADIAKNYDAGLKGSALATVDLQFVKQHCRKPGRLIDLGCGTGRLLIRMAELGYWVLGVDLSEKMLNQAGQKAQLDGVSIHRLKANLVELDCLADNSFDYAACLFSTLGMLSGRGERLRFLHHVQRILHPGGKFILHVHNRWFNSWNPQGRRWLLKNLLGSWFGQSQSGDKVMPVHQGLVGLTLHLFTRCEVIRLVRKVGFRIVQVMPLSLRPDGRLPCPWWFGGLRSFGYLIAAEK